MAKKRRTLVPGKIMEHINKDAPADDAQNSLPEWQQNEGFYAKMAQIQDSIALDIQKTVKKHNGKNSKQSETSESSSESISSCENLSEEEEEERPSKQKDSASKKINSNMSERIFHIGEHECDHDKDNNSSCQSLTSSKRFEKLEAKYKEQDKLKQKREKEKQLRKKRSKLLRKNTSVVLLNPAFGLKRSGCLKLDRRDSSIMSPGGCNSKNSTPGNGQKKPTRGMTFQHLMKSSLSNKFKELKAIDVTSNDEKQVSTFQLTTYAQISENNNSKNDLFSQKKESTKNVD